MTRPIETFRPADLLGPLNAIEAKNAPEYLYTFGDVELLRSGRRISVVGSRRASPAGLDRARALAAVLVDHGITVVSGMALGIDTAAHEAALEARGRTIAVLGTALDQVYPPQNRPLQARIARRDLLVSQFPTGCPMGRHLWPQRNRTMALLSDATIIVEAGEKSGTLHQGWEALRLGRLLILHESVAQDPTLAWPAEMIGYGAQVASTEALAYALAEVPERLRDGALAP